MVSDICCFLLISNLNMVRCLSFWMTKRIELNNSITDVGNGHLPHPFNCDYSQQGSAGFPHTDAPGMARALKPVVSTAEAWDGWCLEVVLFCIIHGILITL